MPKKILVAVLTIAVIAGIYFSRHNSNAPQGGMMMGGNGPVPVDVAAAITKDIVEWDEFSARLEAVDRVEIRPRVAGTIDAIHFSEGEIVKKGQRLFTIDPRTYQADLNKAQADLGAAQAQFNYAKMQNERAVKLLESKAISQREFDETNNTYNVARANVRAADAAVEQARLNMEYTVITAPIAGRISRAEITVGNLIRAGGDAPVLTSIVSTDPIYAGFDADEQTFVKYLHLNEKNPDNLKSIPVMMGFAGSNETPYEGRIQSFDNSLNTASGTIRVRAIFDNKDGTMVPGLFARIKIGGGGKNTVVLANERAINTDQNKKFVYVVGNDNIVAYREVKLGPTDHGLRVIREGLIAGEKIVINGLQRVRPGAPVMPQVVSMETGEVLATGTATKPTDPGETKPIAETNPATVAPESALQNEPVNSTGQTTP